MRILPKSTPITGVTEGKATGTRVIATIDVGDTPIGVGINPTNNLIYIANTESKDIKFQNSFQTEEDCQKRLVEI